MEYLLMSRLPLFTWKSFTIAIKRIQMSSLGSKEALHVIFAVILTKSVIGL